MSPSRLVNSKFPWTEFGGILEVSIAGVPLGNEQRCRSRALMRRLPSLAIVHQHRLDVNPLPAMAYGILQRRIFPLSPLNRQGSKMRHRTVWPQSRVNHCMKPNLTHSPTRLTTGFHGSHVESQVWNTGVVMYATIVHWEYNPLLGRTRVTNTLLRVGCLRIYKRMQKVVIDARAI